MTRPGSGDGFVTLPDGTRRWGRYGAAGILLRHVDAQGRESFFLARRSERVHGGAGRWALPGGAVDHGEDARAAALREFEEEVGVLPGPVRFLGEHRDEHQGAWSYTTVVAEVADRFAAPEHLGWETAEVGWFERADLVALPMHPAFEASLPDLLRLVDGL